MAKPTDSLEWAASGTKTDPGATKIAAGWVALEKPAHGYFNWWQHLASDWVEFLYTDMCSQVMTDTGVLNADVVDTTQIVDDAVTNAKLADMSGRSVKVNAGAASATPTDLVCPADEHLLKRESGSIVFGQVKTGGILDANVTNAKLQDQAAMTVKCNPTPFSGAPSDLAASIDGQVLQRSGTTLVFASVDTDSLAADAVTNAKLDDMTALSVKANTTNASANPTDLVAVSDEYVLKRSGNTLEFGQVDTDGLAADAVTNAKLDNATALSVKANATNASANPTDLAASVDGQVLQRTGTALEFGEVATAGIEDGAVDEDKVSGGVARWAAGALIGTTGGATGSASVVITGSQLTGRVGNVVLGSATATAFGVAWSAEGVTLITPPTGGGGTSLEDYTFNVIPFREAFATRIGMDRVSDDLRVATVDSGGAGTDTSYYFQALRVT